MMMDDYDLRNKLARIRDLAGFLEYVQANYDAAMRSVISPEDTVIPVVSVLNRRMCGGEMCKVAANMLEEIRRLFKEAGVELPETSQQVSGEKVSVSAP